MATSFEVKDLQKNRFTHPLSLSILHLEPFPRRDSNHHCNKISSLKPTGGERGVNGVESALLCSQGDPRISGSLPEMEFPFGLIPVVAVVEQGRIQKRILDLVNQGKILSVKGASRDGLALKLKFSERKWSVTKILNKATCEKLAVEATKKELRQSVHLAGSQTYKEEYMLDIIQVMVLFSSWQNTKKHCRAPISTYVIWSFSGLKRESSHTHSVENVVLTRV
ncbi:hypothetical protein HID58_074394 [Brassica napus]|uniref:Uncharacterized protein n=1 Tax=Brassica napus TaxID=3708 RepID=A0ABQ7YIF0_BRANA|nr:hypothetical protein HID58_074394 [Brassica napus]